MRHLQFSQHEHASSNTRKQDKEQLMATNPNLYLLNGFNYMHLCLMKLLINHGDLLNESNISLEQLYHLCNQNLSIERELFIENIYKFIRMTHAEKINYLNKIAPGMIPSVALIPQHSRPMQTMPFIHILPPRTKTTRLHAYHCLHLLKSAHIKEEVNNYILNKSNQGSVEFQHVVYQLFNLLFKSVIYNLFHIPTEITLPLMTCLEVDKRFAHYDKFSIISTSENIHPLVLFVVYNDYYSLKAVLEHLSYESDESLNAIHLAIKQCLWQIFQINSNVRSTPTFAVILNTNPCLMLLLKSYNKILWHQNSVANDNILPEHLITIFFSFGSKRDFPIYYPPELLLFTLKAIYSDMREIFQDSKTLISFLSHIENSKLKLTLLDWLYYRGLRLSTSLLTEENMIALFRTVQADVFRFLITQCIEKNNLLLLKECLLNINPTKIIRGCSPEEIINIRLITNEIFEFLIYHSYALMALTQTQLYNFMRYFIYYCTYHYVDPSHEKVSIKNPKELIRLLNMLCLDSYILKDCTFYELIWHDFSAADIPEADKQTYLNIIFWCFETILKAGLKLNINLSVNSLCYAVQYLVSNHLNLLKLLLVHGLIIPKALFQGNNPFLSLFNDNSINPSKVDYFIQMINDHCDHHIKQLIFHAPGLIIADSQLEIRWFVNALLNQQTWTTTDIIKTIDFALKSGANVNFVAAGKTLLDHCNNPEIMNFLRRCGAKHYSELTDNEKNSALIQFVSKYSLLGNNQNKLPNSHLKDNVDVSRPNPSPSNPVSCADNLNASLQTAEKQNSNTSLQHTDKLLTPRLIGIISPPDATKSVDSNSLRSNIKSNKRTALQTDTSAAAILCSMALKRRP